MLRDSKGNLLAAAPDLLAACKDMVEQCDAAGWPSLAYACRAAIAKAEGSETEVEEAEEVVPITKLSERDSQIVLRLLSEWRACMLRDSKAEGKE